MKIKLKMQHNKKNITRRDAIKYAGVLTVGGTSVLAGGALLNSCNDNKNNHLPINNSSNNMKVMLVNGSARQQGCTFTALSEVAVALNKNNIETEIMWLGANAISGCRACNGCSKSSKCVIDDSVNSLSSRASEFAGFVFGSPVHYAAASGFITPFLDRLFYSNSVQFAGKLGAAIVSCRRAGSTAALDQLNKYFPINNMPQVPSQYWCMVHGNTPDEVRQDKEGMQIMRTLGTNMAWLIKCIEAGRKNGIDLPQYEQRVGTNFIR